MRPLNGRCFRIIIKVPSNTWSDWDVLFPLNFKIISLLRATRDIAVQLGTFCIVSMEEKFENSPSDTVEN